MATFKKMLALVGVLGLSSSAFALDYPAALRGSYAYQGGECQIPGLVVEQSRRFNDVDVECALKTLTKLSATRFAALEQCNREGREWSQTTVFGLEPSALRVTEGRSQTLFTRCEAPAAVPPPAAAATTKAMSCKVLPGQAGVTTFLDAALSRSGNTIRDFDDYTFRATSKIQVKKTDILVGQLLRSDGTISEAKSWAMADEWECQ